MDFETEEIVPGLTDPDDVESALRLLHLMSSESGLSLLDLLEAAAGDADLPVPAARSPRWSSGASL